MRDDVNQCIEGETQFVPQESVEEAPHDSSGGWRRPRRNELSVSQGEGEGDS